MSQSLSLKIKGLFTSLNELSEVPEGALLTADNIDILKDSIAEPRRGYERLAGGYTSSTDRTDRTWWYQDKQFAHHGTLGSAGTVSYLNSSTWSSVGSYSAPSGVKMRHLEANQNLFFTSSTGVQKLDAYNGTALLAGAYKALDIQASTSASASTWLATASSVAYRILWGYKDANGNVVTGASSQREIYTNSAGADKAVDLALTIPTGVTTAWFYQIYRSTTVASSVEPSDELGLVYEGNPSGAEIIAKTLTVTDIVPAALRGSTIYTAASQEGLANQNERPPLCKDMAVFRDTTFFANTTAKHRFFLTILSTTGATGLQADDTITIGGVAFTAKASETIASGQFKVFTGGSAAQDIRDTAISLIRVINRYASSTVYAYYMSTPDEAPGEILIEERSIGGAAIPILSSRATCWNPSLSTSGTNDVSTNDAFPNGLAWSKPNQPESVPLPNFVQVGSKNAAILRIVPLKDALMIFKEDGIYKLTGYAPNFSVEVFDASAVLQAVESPAVLNGQIFCLTDQGVTVISDGVKVISRPIEQDILQLFGASLTKVQTLTWGLAYESDRKYYLFMITGAGDDYATQAYVYNVFTSSWVRHTLKATAGVYFENRLYIADAQSHYILKDRKNYTYLDYADFLAATTITAIDGDQVTLGSGADTVAIGDILYQSSTLFSVITAIDPITSIATVQTDPGFTVAAADLLKAIETDIEWAPITTGNPAIQKQYHTAILLFKADFQGTGYLTFSSDLSQFDESVPLTGTSIGAWGLFTWGDGAPWGGVSLKRPVRQWVPRNKQRASQLTISFQHAWGFSAWQLEGISVFGTPGTEKVSK